MKNQPENIVKTVLKGGIFFGSLVYAFLLILRIMFPFLAELLSTPSDIMATLWFEMGLPPRGDASVTLRFIFMVVQCFSIGVFIVLLRYFFKPKR